MRVVSLVPSLTEAVAATLPGALVGATDWCTHPAGLDVPRVGGSKYPDLDRVRALRPDVVLLNVEENRREDADALVAAGMPVRVTYPRTVDGALTELADLLTDLGAPGEPEWLVAARRAWAGLTDEGPPRRALVPVWRRPWVVLGRGTFAGDVLRRLGLSNLYAEHGERYPRPSLDELRGRAPQLVVLPDEPYRFTASDGPEEFPGVPCALVSGRHLTWYGPSLAEAPAVLAAQLAAPVTP
ncbi:helical backbone metal receptor [Salinispora arenicola]|uniref:Fe/B12 periplasmic-binding domain-containing protein n=1 Tax=Salinispora arenicola (strain CNS-205) TaxID=391037 RepID=A8M1E5_SALAI|nr:helical backbone metal receptor [Salinispora arenicola]NIL58434.1 cobalamin-binding protein [Salinispora arenicola]NIL62258.1 cobalamin-binding protein [Salinispora arenicola]